MILFDKFWTQILIRLFSSKIYSILLRLPIKSNGFQPGRDPWPGNADRANAIFQGNYFFANNKIQLPNQDPWKTEGVSEQWIAEANSFEWIRDFHADGGEAAKKGARQLISTWLETHENWDLLTWRPDILGRRILAWCSHSEFILDNADSHFRHNFLDSIKRQGKHLEYSWRMASPGVGTLTALMGLATIHACLGWKTRTAQSLNGFLETEIRKQILEDGCHISRNPSIHLKILRDFIWLQKIFLHTNISVPESLTNAIQHMGPILKFFRHGDGALALFHGSAEEDRTLVTETLAAFPGKSKINSTAPYGNYERLAAGPSLVFIDTGAPSPDPFTSEAHAGTLALEFSIGRERLIVNCGHGISGDWKNASRATAAHSTVTLGNFNSSEILPSGLGSRPKNVTVKRHEVDGNAWLDAEHDGYKDRLGFFHRRRVYLAADGSSLRGEDTIEGPGKNNKGGDFTLRFHLHPTVRVSLTSDGALLRLPGGTGWNFRVIGGNLTLEESIYISQPNEIRRSEQMIIAGGIKPPVSTIRWGFSRIES